MSHNQSRVEKSDGQLRKSSGRSGHNRGFSGSGGGKSGGDAAPPHQLSSSSNPPSLSSNRSFKKSGSGQGGQFRINPVSLGSEASAATATSKAVQNGTHGQRPSEGSSTTPMPSGPKQGDAPVPRTSRALPKAPFSQPDVGFSDSAAPSTPVKGDGTKPFALQFGTISPGIVNGLHIPARTNSAPPNLDEQKRDQARHDSFRSVPTQPISSGPKQQLPTARKDVVGVNQSTSAESHPPVQVKREMHQQIPTVPFAPPAKSAALPIPGISMAMPFQQQHIPMQFGGPGPQHMPMTLPIGNTPQVPQQMFVHNLQSHPLQPQTMIHQGQGLGFGPQITHQLGPQLGSMGIGITAPQFAQQQPGKFGGPRKTTTVKITHPETHEELRLDKRTDSYTDGASSGQRPPNNVTPQSQPIASFTPSHYFPQLQASSYNPSPIFFPPSTSVTTGSQPPRFSYLVRQSGQPISFMNPSLLNSMPGSKSQPPLHGPAEPIKSEPSLVTVTSAPTQGSVKPTSVPSCPKVGGPSVTISMPVSKAEEPKLLKPPGEATLVRPQRDGQVSTESFSQHPETFTQSSGSTTSTASGGRPSAVASVVTQRALPGTSLAPAIPSVESGPVAIATDGKKREPVRRSDSLKDHQKKSSKKELRSSQQQQQTDESASVTSTNLSSVKISKGGSAEDVKSMQLAEGSEHILQSSGADVLTTTTSLASCGPENSVNTKARTGLVVESNAIPAETGSSGVIMKEAPKDVPMSCSDSCVIHSSDGISVQEKGLLKVSSSSGAEMDENIAGDLDSAVSQIDNASAKVECIKKMPEELEDGKSEVSEISVLDSSNTKVYPVPTIAEAFEDVKPVVFVKQEDSETNNSEKLIDTGAERQIISTDVERKMDEIDRLAPTSSENQKTACNDEDLPLSLHPVKNELETTCSHVGSTLPGPSLPEAVVVEAPVTFERINKSGPNIMEVPNESPTPSLTSGPKDKLASESTKAKPITGKKKKRREILSKADAAGTSDLYNAYKGPEEKDQLVSTSESVDSSLTVDGENAKADAPDKDVVANEEDGQSKGEVDDWEDAADVSTPKLENGKEVNELNKRLDDDGSEATGTKKYTRDFLLTYSDQCADLPIGFEIGSDIADALMSVPLGSSHVEHDHYPSPGRITDRSPGLSRGDRRGIGLPNDDRWIKTPIPLHDIRNDVGHNFRPGQGVNYGVLRNPRGQPSNQFVPILSGPMQTLVPQGGLVHNNSDADRWGRYNSRGIMPPPQTPLQVMHKAERRYEIGKVSDKEQGKQRQLKAVLNKLTPQNFEKLFQQVKEVNIDNTVTLSGVIAQIFDKALMEPTFCEMYANFCFHLSDELPDFVENDEKITFKRLLLNKCQEEFERGEREQAEANRVEEEGEIKQSDEEREEKRIKARRRMLGNIRLIGELYKKKMLTERIMHACIQKLLGQHQNPDEEDLEALCKLMSTIGDQIDHAKAKEHMDAYFDIMLKLSTNQKLSSRVRFTLRDVIDLRKNRWQQRRKVEGPKKIEEVHRDAAQERQSQTSRLTRGPSMNSASRRGPPVDYGPRGSAVLPSPNSQTGGIRGLPTQTRGYGMQDVRLEHRHPLENRTLSLPLTQRATDDSSITLGPQGGLARGMSIRGQPAISSVPLAESPLGIVDDRRMTSNPNGYSSTPDRITYSSREDVPSRYMPDRLSESSFDQPAVQDRNVYVVTRESRVTDHSFDRVVPTTAPAGRTQGSSGGSSNAASDAKPLSEEVLREKSMSTIREFYSAKDENEVALCIKELNSPSFCSSMVSIWVTDSFERKDMERDLLAKLLVNLCNSRDSLLSQVDLTQGFEYVLSSLEDAVNDAPRAAEFLGRIFVKVILENVVPLRDIGKLIHEGGEEPGHLLKSGLASDVLGSILETIKTEKGDSVLNEILTSSKLRLEDFRPLHPGKSKKLDGFLRG